MNTCDKYDNGDCGGSALEDKKCFSGEYDPCPHPAQPATGRPVSTRK